MHLAGDSTSEYFKVLSIWNDGKMIDAAKELLFFPGRIDPLTAKDVYLVRGRALCTTCEEINLNATRYSW